MALGRQDDADVLPAEAAKMIDDLVAFGAPEHVIAQTRARLKPAVREGAFLVHPANVPAVKVFLAMQTQWREVGTMNRILRRGLDYGVLPIVAAAEGVAPLEGADFRRLQILEVEALNAWHEARQ